MEPKEIESTVYDFWFQSLLYLDLRLMPRTAVLFGRAEVVSILVVFGFALDVGIRRIVWHGSYVFQSLLYLDLRLMLRCRSYRQLCKFVSILVVFGFALDGKMRYAGPG